MCQAICVECENCEHPKDIVDPRPSLFRCKVHTLRRFEHPVTKIIERGININGEIRFIRGETDFVPCYLLNDDGECESFKPINEEDNDVTLC